MIECKVDAYKQKLVPKEKIPVREEGINHIAIPQERYTYLLLKLNDYGLENLLTEEIPKTEEARINGLLK